MSAQFQEHRLTLGVNATSTRVLTRLQTGPCGLQELEQATYLGRDAVEDTLAELVVKGDVVRNRTELFELTSSGTEKHAAVADRSATFTEEKLRGISDSDIAAATRVLLELHTR